MQTMVRQLLILAAAVLVLGLTAELVLRDADPAAVPADGAGTPAAELEPIVPPRTQYVADISLHSVQELETLFRRVEQLLERPRRPDETPLVSVVLHGPEVEFFAFRNYSRYRDVVDRAAKLAALGAVDISICQTQMRSRGIAEDEVPGFLRQVPYGPDEVRKLRDRGYVYM
jgi:intracellular sulfur oxidation DsrE/DsrF family protein